MPREIFDKNWQFLEKNAMLSFEEILEVVDSFVIFGLKKKRPVFNYINVFLANKHA